MTTILAADIGGTNCRFGVFSLENGLLRLQRAIWIPTSSVSCTGDFLLSMERETELPVEDAGCVVAAIAGPVFGSSRGRLTNGALELDFESHDRQVFWIMNDFMAQAWCVMSPESMRAEKICGPDEAAGSRAVIGAGTGLGYASMAETDAFSPKKTGKTQWQALPSENGHSAFPFVNAGECAFGEFLCRNLNIPQATCEDVLAARGLALLHQFLTGKKLTPREVGTTALAEETDTLVWYSRFYGRLCRNWILATLCTGGLWIAGGIAAQNPLCVRNSHFIAELRGNPGWRNLLENVPVYLLTNKNSGLWGAACFGARMCEQTNP